MANWGGLWGALIGAGLSAYEANRNRKDNQKTNDTNRELWEKGYWSVRSPYMESQIQPALQAILARAGELYGKNLGLNFSSPLSPQQMYGGMTSGGMLPGLGGAPGQGQFPFSQGPQSQASLPETGSGRPDNGYAGGIQQNEGVNSGVHATTTIGQGLGSGDNDFRYWLGGHPLARHLLGAGLDQTGLPIGALLNHLALDPGGRPSYASIQDFLRQNGASTGLQSDERWTNARDANGGITGQVRVNDGGAMQAADITAGNIQREHDRHFGGGNVGSNYFGPGGAAAGGGGGHGFGQDSLDWYAMTNPYLF